MKVELIGGPKDGSVVEVNSITSQYQAICVSSIVIMDGDYPSSSMPKTYLWRYSHTRDDGRVCFGMMCDA